MNVIDRSQYRDEDGSIGLVDRIRGIWKFGLTWYKETQAQDRLIDHLHSQLNNKYTLVRDVVLPGLDIPIPMVLIGPTGIRVFYASGSRGIYRAKESSWAVMDNRSRQYRSSEPNLIKRTALLAHSILTFLISKGYQIEDLEPVLYFSDPNFHVDAIQPVVRIVLTDGASRYIENFSQYPDLFDDTAVNRIADTLAEIKLDPITPSTQKKLRIGSLELYGWQWLVLATLVILQLCVLLIFIILNFMVT